MPDWRKVVIHRLRPSVLERDGHRCVYCGFDRSVRLLVMDHVVPRSLGGPDAEWNLVTACFNCNARRGSTLGFAQLEFLAQRLVERGLV